MKYESMIEAQRLRKELGLPINEIAKQLKVSKGTVSIWVRNIQLTEEQHQILRNKNPIYNRQLAGHQKHKLKARNKRIVYQENGKKRAKEKSLLHMAGCMLYWAEGGKSRNNLQFANSDPYMLKFFLNFLLKEFNINVNDISIRGNVHLNNNLSITEIQKYWLNFLNLPSSCLRKFSISKLPRMSSGKKKNKLPYGVLTIEVHSTEIIQHIYGAIQEYGNFKNDVWLDK